MPQEVVPTGPSGFELGDCEKSFLHSGALIALHRDCWVGEGLGNWRMVVGVVKGNLQIVQPSWELRGKRAHKQYSLAIPLWS